jgi:hypothetical protein
MNITFFGAWGCATVKNVTNDPDYPTDYIVGRVYTLTQPVFVKRMSSAHWLVRPGQHGDVPEKIEEYQRREGKPWPKVRSWLPIGTRIRYDSMFLEKNYSIGIYYRLRGVVLDPPESGLMVELLFVSQWPGDKPATHPPRIDSNILQEAEPKTDDSQKKN